MNKFLSFFHKDPILNNRSLFPESSSTSFGRLNIADGLLILKVVKSSGNMRLTGLLSVSLALTVFLLAFAQQTEAELVDNGDTTITDTRSGLMWLKYPLTARPYIPEVDSTVDWYRANDEISDLNTYVAPGGFSNWRLPMSPATGDTILRALDQHCAAQGKIFGVDCWGPFDVGPPNVGRTFWTAQEFPAPGGDSAVTFGTVFGRMVRPKSSFFLWAWAVRGGDVPNDKEVLFVGQTGESSNDGKSMIVQVDPQSGSVYRAFVSNPSSSGEADGVTVSGDLVYVLSSTGNNADITVMDHWGIPQDHFSVASLVDTPSALEGLTRNPDNGLLILGYSRLVGSGDPSKLLFVNATNGSLVSSVPLTDPSAQSPFQVSHAVGLDVDGQGKIFVLTSDGRIQTYNPQGDRLLDELETGIFKLELDTTLGLAFTGNGFLISGIFTDAIYRVNLSGQFVRAFPVPGPFSEALDMRVAGIPDGADGGGGCSLSASGEGDIVEFLLPYAALPGVMIIWKLRDGRNQGARKATKTGC